MMFDRTTYPDPELLAAQPFVSTDALAALSALLSLALKDRTPSAALLSGASRASHDQNRGETDVTRDAQCHGTDTDTIDDRGRSSTWICAAGLHPRLLAIPFQDFAETKIVSEGECLQAKGSQHV